MCGRYYVDDETAQEIERLVRKIGEEMRMKTTVSQSAQNMAGDVYPSNQACVMNKENEVLSLSDMKWGFQGFQKNLVINAKCETVTEKRMFQDSVMHRRCIIPAAGFYEWNQSKEKVTFTRKDDSLLYLAGFWNIQDDDKNHFVILTTGANNSVIDVHDRMPLILEQSELKDWIFDDQCMDDLLHKIPVNLKKSSGYEQITLPFV